MKEILSSAYLLLCSPMDPFMGQRASPDGSRRRTARTSNLTMGKKVKKTLFQTLHPKGSASNVVLKAIARDTFPR